MMKKYIEFIISNIIDFYLDYVVWLFPFSLYTRISCVIWGKVLY
ncbi:hypothetical protein HMPREF1548_00348 [Clostridium sp. KLE 1755]|nr:hypothetical protein HMPREF1548_00348 [Clostridium sp. KLE 1755]